VVNTLRQGPYWQDTVIFITYDEHGGYYDVPAARQGFARTPDGISPGHARTSPIPAEPAARRGSATDTSVNGAAAQCPDFATDPTGPFPAHCASFDQLGVRVPFLAISPFSKLHYVSHRVGDHASILAFIEKRFMNSGSNDGDDDSGDRDNREVTRQFLTKRDKHAHTPEDMFDFDGSPPANTAITVAAPPTQDCTPK
jgi:phospholipase C